MRAVLLTGHGGLEKLELHDDVPVPAPGPGEVLIKVGAAGMNNTDINTRAGWYSKAVTSGTTSEGAAEGFGEIASRTSTWGGAAVEFPRIQGADVCGRIAAAGEGVDAARVGARVLVDPWIRDPADPGDRAKARYFGSERDGGFAEFCVAPSANAVAIESPLSDAELATFPCSSSTAEHMLHRARVAAGDTVLVTGASGGVGSALVQLARRRGARVVAVAGRSKADLVAGFGADQVIAREDDLAAELAGRAPDVVADVVGGPRFPLYLDLLARGGRYVTAGAIAGPLVELDLRTLYLKDLELIGATVLPPEVFRAMIAAVEDGTLKPLLAKTFPLAEIRAAQAEFMQKAHVGNFVLLP